VRVHGAEPRVQEERVGDAQRDPEAGQEQGPGADEELGEERREAAEGEPQVQGEGVADQLREGVSGRNGGGEGLTQSSPVGRERRNWVGGLVAVGLKIGVGGGMVD
jgi:hypothetical protein